MSSALFITNIGFLHDFALLQQFSMSWDRPCSKSSQLLVPFWAPMSHAKDLLLTRICVSRLSVIWTFEKLDSKLVWQNFLWLLPFCEILWHKMALCSFDLHHKIYREYEFYLKCYSWDNPASAQFDQLSVLSPSLCQAPVTVSFRKLVIISNYCQYDIKLCTFHKIIPQRHI